MRVVIQRVSKASVQTPEGYYSYINKGLMVLVGIAYRDTVEDADWLASKIIGLRIFDDDNGVMNLSIKDVSGDILLISQFTLMARTKKGNRPSYVDAANHQISIPLYQYFISKLESLLSRKVFTGVFGSYMKVELINDGPVTIVIDTDNKN